MKYVKIRDFIPQAAELRIEKRDVIQGLGLSTEVTLQLGVVADVVAVDALETLQVADKAIEAKPAILLRRVL